MVIPPFQKVMLPVQGEVTYAPPNGAVEATLAFERRNALLVSVALVTLTEVKTLLQITNPHKQTYKLKNRVTVAKFKLATPQQNKQ